MTADFIIRHAALITCAGATPRRGPAQGEVAVISDGAIAARRGTIIFAGETQDCERLVSLAPGGRQIEAAGRTVIPGLVDPHTHLVYAGDRNDEIRRRLGGVTYTQIAAEGGGILATVQATREASADALLQSAHLRLDEMLRCGTTTCEIKSGYGLDTENELKMLGVIRRLDTVHPVDCIPTFLGAHEVPPEYRNRREAFVAAVIRDMLPAVGHAGLAAWCDVFCEGGVFSADEAREILEAGIRYGLKPRIHADELTDSGGAAVAAAVGARSADHLIFVSDDGIRSLASSVIVATLLPAAAFYLKLGRFAPARRLIAAGVPVALATDLNPGGGLSPSMPFAITAACFGMEMTLEEALVAATINAAYSLDVHARVGSLEPGKLLDALVLRGDLTELLRVGADAIDVVLKRGQVVVDRRGDGGPARSRK